MYAALLTWFIRRPDDGPVQTETCSLSFIKYDVPDVNCFIILVFKTRFSGNNVSLNLVKQCKVYVH
jgi:hypothetical protein